MKRFLVPVAAALSLAIGPVAVVFAQSPMPGGQSQAYPDAEMSAHRVARAEVLSVDTKTDEVTVKSQDGREMKLAVAPTTAERLKTGDKIEVVILVKVLRPGE